jgi:signal transduction histidine kinase
VLSTPAIERIQGRSLLLVRIAWICVALLTAAVWLATIPARYDELRQTAGSVLSPAVFASYEIALFALSAAVFEGVGALLVWHRSGARMALVSALALVTFPVYASPQSEIDRLAPPLHWIGTAVGIVGVAALISSIYLLPDGRFEPRWTYLLMVPWLPIQAAHQIAAGTVWDYGTWPAPIPLLAAMAGLGPAIGVMLYRYVRLSSGAQRQQTAWLMWGVVLAVVVVLATDFVVRLLPPVLNHNLLVHAAADTARVCAALLVPTAIALAIVRHRLWAIDLIVHRTLLYGILTAIVVALYVVVVGALGRLVSGRGDALVSLLATGMVALLFQPLRGRLQRSVNRLVYGERDDPHHVLSRLGERLEETLAPDDVLPTIVETIGRALKLTYVAIALPCDDGPTVVAAHGKAVAAPFQQPLVYRQELVGHLLVAPRPGSESLSSADARVLAELTRQVAVAVQATRLRGRTERLSDQLRQAHTRLVTLREEERRRLRRDLHDGLGPALASVTLQAENARDLVRTDPDQAEAVLEELTAQAQAAIADIRRVVYDLRPPALDDLGLVEAARALAARLSGNQLSIIVDAEDDLAPLPAAVEVACYRIIQEALTNVVRHAGAGSCVVSLYVADTEHGEGLVVEVTDDGHGLPLPWDRGIGLQSMKARAAELCGDCVVRSPAGSGRGTRVTATLPLACPGTGES